MSGMLKVFDGSVWQNIGLVDPSSGGSLPYKVYTALVSQAGTSAPTATVLQNTIGTITWTYDDVGSYVGTCTGCFTGTMPIYVTVTNQLGWTDGSYWFINVSKVDNDSVSMKVGDVNGSVDEALYSDFIELRIYP